MTNFKFLLGLSMFLSFSTSPAAVLDAVNVARSSVACKKIQPFYWEIGNSAKMLAGQSVGEKYLRTSNMNVASASKFIFGAYVLEKKKGILTSKEKNNLRMLGGYTDFNPFSCGVYNTVSACFRAGTNSKITSSAVGKYYYNGGNAMSVGIDLGLGSLSLKSLNSEMTSTLKNTVSINYVNPNLAGGIQTSAAQYAIFLQQLLKGNYVLSKYLGYTSVCTLPGRCTAAASSPVPEAWNYSYHHWVERNAAGAVEAFSSPGLLGFYPWVTADKAYYGILAREESGADSSWDSVVCGREIRKAYFK